MAWLAGIFTRLGPHMLFDFIKSINPFAVCAGASRGRRDLISVEGCRQVRYRLTPGVHQHAVSRASMEKGRELRSI